MELLESHHIFSLAFKILHPFWIVPWTTIPEMKMIKNFIKKRSDRKHLQNFNSGLQRVFY